MIFVTVGTHEQQFNRLVECMDNYAAKHEEKVIIQSGFSTYVPKHCEFSKLYSYQKMLELVDEARIVITHGGPSSFIMPLRMGKTPIVVPRMKDFDEHVNNHQVNFCRQAAKRLGTIIEVEDMDELIRIIDRYDDETKKMKKENSSNNAEFCRKFESIVDEMFREKK